MYHGIATVGPIHCDGEMPEVMTRLARQTETIVSQGKIPVTLGGEHSLTYGAVSGVSQALGAKLVLFKSTLMLICVLPIKERNIPTPQ